MRPAESVIAQRLPPTRDEIDEWFTAVPADTRTRDEADHWPAQRHTSPAAHLLADEVTFRPLARIGLSRRRPADRRIAADSMSQRSHCGR
ncbi:hypothetical protein ACQPZJ_15670 [Actinoplanes sp. CA-054009]